MSRLVHHRPAWVAQAQPLTNTGESLQQWTSEGMDGGVWGWGGDWERSLESDLVALPQPCQVTLSTAVPFSEPQFPHL